MLPHILHSTTRAAAVVHNQTQAFRNVLQLQSSGPSSGSGSSRGNGPSSGGSKFNAGSRYHVNFNVCKNFLLAVCLLRSIHLNFQIMLTNTSFGRVLDAP